MPAMTYRLRWPDQAESECYSPSLVIRDFFEAGADYPVEDFLRRMREATAIASARVQARFGFPCARALAQLDAIEVRARCFRDLDQARVVILSFSSGT